MDIYTYEYLFILMQKGLCLPLLDVVRILCNNKILNISIMCSKFLVAELDSKSEGKREIWKTSIMGLQLYKTIILKVKVGILFGI